MIRDVRVYFVRLKANSDEAITKILASYYVDGWRVVSHADADGEYSFVMELTQKKGQR